MKRLVLLAALALSACATTPHTPRQTAYELESAYLGVVRLELAYKSLPPCQTTSVLLCSDPAKVAKMLAADDKAWTAIQTAKAALLDPNASAGSVQSAVTYAQAALAILTSITAP